MADNQKYYYLKLKDNFFDTDEMIVLESMPDGYLYSNILLKLYLRSLKYNGRLMFNERISFNSTMLAQVTRHNVGVVEKAMQIFQELGLVEILDNGAIYLSDIQNFIGKSTTEADRIRSYRKKIESEKAGVQMLYKCTPEIEIEIELETDTELDTEIEKKPISAKPKKNRAEYSELFERFWKAYPKKVAKGTAVKAFKKAKVDESLLQDILKALEWQRETKQWKAEGGQYIPNPATYLNGRRWEDEQEEQPNGTNDISGTCEYKLDVLRL